MAGDGPAVRRRSARCACRAPQLRSAFRPSQWPPRTGSAPRGRLNASVDGESATGRGESEPGMPISRPAPADLRRVAVGGPSRPVPLLIHTAGVLASSDPSGLRRREAIVMKQRPRASTSGRCSSQCSPSVRVSGVRPASAMAGNASSGLQLAIASPRSGSRTRYSGASGSLTAAMGVNSSTSAMSVTTKPGLPFSRSSGASAEAGARSGCTTSSESALVGDVSQPIGGQPRNAVDIELDQSLGLFGQARQCGGDAGHARSTKRGVSRVPRSPAQLTQSTHARPAIAIILSTIDRHGN